MATPIELHQVQPKTQWDRCRSGKPPPLFGIREGQKLLQLFIGLPYTGTGELVDGDDRPHALLTHLLLSGNMHGRMGRPCCPCWTSTSPPPRPGQDHRSSP